MEFTKDLLSKLRTNLDTELGDDELTKTVLPAFERAVIHTLLDTSDGATPQAVKGSRLKAGSKAAKDRAAKAAATRAANKATRIGGGPAPVVGGEA